MKFHSVVATNSLDANGNVFSKEALEEMVKDMVGKPITLNFTNKLVGKVESAALSGSKLEATGELYDDVFLDAFYCVPMVEVDDSDIHEQGDTKFVKHIKRVMSFGLTLEPADKNTTQVEKVGNETDC